MTTDTWMARLRGFFEDEPRNRALASVLDAQGCREGWVQAELFRAFGADPDFRLNCRASVSTAIPDIACGTAMVGEVKIIGADYQSKCITGGALRPYLSGDRRVTPDRREELHLGVWGLIPDYFKLLDATGLDADAERILVLIADVTESASGHVADALRTIAFEGEVSTTTLPRGFVRMWNVGKMTT